MPVFQPSADSREFTDYRSASIAAQNPVKPPAGTTAR